MRHFLLITTVFFCPVLLIGPPCPAQESNLDKATLIDGLAREGMSELLLHLIETEPPADQVAAGQIQIAQHRVEYRRLGEQADQLARSDPEASAESLAASHRAFDQMLEATRRLIDEHYDHMQRPIWQTDLAEALLFEFLRNIHRSAAEFYGFGVTTLEQKRSFEQIVVEALEATSDADLRFFAIQGEIGRDAKLANRLQNNGVFFQLFDDYAPKRTPFFLAHAAYYTAILPETHSYYARLGQTKNPRIIEQQPDPDAERERLLNLAVNKLASLASDKSDQAGVRFASLVLTGRALLELDRHDEATEAFDTVITARTGDHNDLIANLGRVSVSQRSGRFEPALGLLEELKGHAAVKPNLLYRLLVTDLTHRVLLAQGAESGSAEASADAYEPYLDLLDDPSVGANLVPLQNLVYRRWEQSLTVGTDLAGLPPVVRMAISQISRQEGQNLAIEADEQDDDDLREQAVKKLGRAIDLGETLQAEDLGPAIRARAMLNLGLATYFMDKQDVAGILDAARIFTDLADQMPDQPVAEEGITYAVQVLNAVHQTTPRPAGVAEAYRRATQVLFEKFPTTTAADNERVYYAYELFQLAGSYEEAARHYQQVPVTHPDYFEARREMLFCLGSYFAEAKGYERERAREQLVDWAERIRTEAEAEAVRSDDPERAASARRALGGARLVLADMAQASGQIDLALERLDGFERDFAGDPDLIHLALERRIILLAGAAQGPEASDGEPRTEQLSTAAAAMMADYPDDAAAVIDGVIGRIDQQIEQLTARAAEELVEQTRTQMMERSKRLASTAAVLSALLLDWAQQQGFDAEQMLPFELIRVKVLRQSGNADQTLDMMKRIFVTFPDDADVLHHYGETLVAQSDEQSLIRAATYFDTLIEGLSAPYPDIWWNAWMRRLQINDRLDTFTDQIALTIRQLRLTDPNLGGRRYKREFDRLETKHAL